MDLVLDHPVQSQRRENAVQNLADADVLRLKPNWRVGRHTFIINGLFVDPNRQLAGLFENRQHVAQRHVPKVEIPLGLQGLQDPLFGLPLRVGRAGGRERGDGFELQGCVLRIGLRGDSADYEQQCCDRFCRHGSIPGDRDMVCSDSAELFLKMGVERSPYVILVDQRRF